MRVLFLGSSQSPLVAFLKKAGEEVLSWEAPITIDFLRQKKIEFIVSYGYRHILRPAVLDPFRGKVVNLHISFLPWNRGADPNLWSFIENTPKGVTIHQVDAGVDTGAIIAQEKVAIGQDETLRSSYSKLQAAIEDLFSREWAQIRSGCPPSKTQAGVGTTHRLKDKESLVGLLSKGWDTPVSILQQYGQEHSLFQFHEDQNADRRS